MLDIRGMIRRLQLSDGICQTYSLQEAEADVDWLNVAKMAPL